MTQPHTDRADRRQRRREAIRLHEIEGNPFTPEDNALFEMFDQNGLTDEQRRTFLIKGAKRRANAPTAKG